MNQSAEHACDFFELLFQRQVVRGRDDPAPQRQFEQRHTFLGRAAGNSKKVASIGLRETPIALSDVGGNGKGRPAELIDKKCVAAWKGLGMRADLIGELNGFLVDGEFLERECHGRSPWSRSTTSAESARTRKERVESRPRRAAAFLSLSFLLSTLSCSIRRDGEWTGPGLNRRHLNFQSSALPAELPVRTRGRRFGERRRARHQRAAHGTWGRRELSIADGGHFVCDKPCLLNDFRRPAAVDSGHGLT